MLGSRTGSALGEERSRPTGGSALTFACAVALASPCVSGCRAVAALAETRRAERALVSTQGLRDTPAARYALTMGRAYLEKAREEAAEAHYGNAVVYARAASEAAHDAQRTQLKHRTARLAPEASVAKRFVPAAADQDEGSR